MIFKFKHSITGEEKRLNLTEEDMANLIDYDTLLDEFFKVHSCDCEPVGETNVIECGCDDYLCDFELLED